MASIVYDGVGGGGALFKDMKFFILQRVPMRSRWIELIKSNGDTPPGAVSWKFIDKSAKAGRLVDIEEYRCGLPVGAAGANRARAPASAQPGKSTRTPFTAADDRLLTKWVLKADRKGLSTKGNRIYMELEAQYPHHTYQSWLDRWKRQLLPRYNAGNLHYETEMATHHPPKGIQTLLNKDRPNLLQRQSSRGRSIDVRSMDLTVPKKWRNYFNAEFLPRELKAREKKKQEKIKSELSAANRREVQSCGGQTHSKISTSDANEAFYLQGRKFFGRKNLLKVPLHLPSQKHRKPCH
ncbi:hypothetical protein DID88_004404 [Monilinia fructigena]|uniref:DNA-binding protein RAP1 n=1 Tax=Monilinia fructigena TaxID=38457 RepID=A0A395IRT0_9HELO|nr:hypothetical protein DID88_004404 [Monilinia fructigena]